MPVRFAARRKVQEMADLDELFGPESWMSIQNELKRGEDPEISEIALALRGSQPVPHDVRICSRGRLGGSVDRR